MPAAPARSIGNPACIDAHVHLVGVGSGGNGCFVSERMRRTVVFHILRRWLRLNPKDPGADADYAARLAALIEGAAHVDAAVILGMDGVYDAGGRLLHDKSHLYVPNDYLFEVCRKYPGMLPGASVNPMRADWREELAWCDEQGAVLIKWLPPLQYFDPASPAFDAFYQELARRDIPLLGHTGCEHTFPDQAQEFGHPSRYRRALEAGVTVIAAHSGMSCPFHRRWHDPEEVLRLMRRFPRLYADNSALASLLKHRHLRRLAVDEFPDRFLHGSDYPIPSLALPFARQLGLANSLRLQLAGNALELDWQIKKAAGMPERSFTEAARVLRVRLERWMGADS